LYCLYCLFNAGLQTNVIWKAGGLGGMVSKSTYRNRNWTAEPKKKKKIIITKNIHTHNTYEHCTLTLQSVRFRHSTTKSTVLQLRPVLSRLIKTYAHKRRFGIKRIYQLNVDLVQISNLHQPLLLFPVTIIIAYYCLKKKKNTISI